MMIEASGFERMSAEFLAEIHDTWLDGLEFCAKVYRIFEKFRESPNGPSKLRMRQDGSKKLIEELFPICRFVQTRYGPGRYIQVRWMNSSRTYDAEIKQAGRHVEMEGLPQRGFLEVTTAQHKKDYLKRELINKEGFSFGPGGVRREGNEILSQPVFHRNNEFVQEFSEIIFVSIRKKIEKDYPTHTTIIVQCNLQRLYMRDEWELLMSLIWQQIINLASDNLFAKNLPNFEEIFLYDPMGEYSCSFRLCNISNSKIEK